MCHYALGAISPENPYGMALFGHYLAFANALEVEGNVSIFAVNGVRGAV